MFDKCLHLGSNLQLAPPCDHCLTHALPTELPPLMRSYLWIIVNYRNQIKYDFSELDDCGNSAEIFSFWLLMIMIMMWGSLKSQHEINFAPAHLNK